MGTFKAKYTGNAKGDIRAFGTTFPEGKAAEVDDRFRAKVDGNKFFSISGSTAKKNEQPADQQAANTDTTAALEAKHRGAGSYSVMDGETEVLEKLSKDDAEAFNSMSDADKAEYVKAEQAKNAENK